MEEDKFDFIIFCVSCTGLAATVAWAWIVGC